MNKYGKLDLKRLTASDLNTTLIQDLGVVRGGNPTTVNPIPAPAPSPKQPAPQKPDDTTIWDYLKGLLTIPKGA